MCFGDGRNLSSSTRKLEQQLSPEKRRILNRIHEFLDLNEDNWRKWVVIMVRSRAIKLLYHHAPPPDHHQEYRSWVRELRSEAALVPYRTECLPQRLEEAVKTAILLEKAWLAERIEMGKGGSVDLRDVVVSDMEDVKHLFRRVSKEESSAMFQIMFAARYGMAPPPG